MTSAVVSRRKAAIVPASFTEESRLDAAVARQPAEEIVALVERGQFFTERLRDPELTDYKRQRCREAALTVLLDVKRQGRLWGLNPDNLSKVVGDVRAEIRLAFLEGERAHHATRRELAYVS